MSEAAAPRQTSPMQIPKVSEVRSSMRDPKTEEEDPSPSTTGAMDRACQCQTARSRLSGRLAVVESGSSIEEVSRRLKSTIPEACARLRTQPDREAGRTSLSESAARTSVVWIPVETHVGAFRKIVIRRSQSHQGVNSASFRKITSAAAVVHPTPPIIADYE